MSVWPRNEHSKSINKTGPKHKKRTLTILPTTFYPALYAIYRSSYHTQYKSKMTSATSTMFHYAPTNALNWRGMETLKKRVEDNNILMETYTNTIESVLNHSECPSKYCVLYDGNTTITVTRFGYRGSIILEKQKNTKFNHPPYVLSMKMCDEHEVNFDFDTPQDAARHIIRYGIWYKYS